jgi:hypothetical protein
VCQKILKCLCSCLILYHVLECSSSETHRWRLSISARYAVFMLNIAQALRVEAAHAIRPGYGHVMPLFVINRLVVIRVRIVTLPILIHLKVILFLQIQGVISAESPWHHCVILVVLFSCLMHQAVGGQRFLWLIVILGRLLARGNISFASFFLKWILHVRIISMRIMGTGRILNLLVVIRFIILLTLQCRMVLLWFKTLTISHNDSYNQY